VPPPRILVSGVRGSGVHTQLKKLHEKYKIPILDFRKNLLALLESEKLKRRNNRKLIKDFAPYDENAQKELDEEGKEKLDPEIEKNDPSDFEKKKPLEVDLSKTVFKDSNEIF